MCRLFRSGARTSLSQSLTARSAAPSLGSEARSVVSSLQRESPALHFFSSEEVDVMSVDTEETVYSPPQSFVYEELVEVVTCAVAKLNFGKQDDRKRICGLLFCPRGPWPGAKSVTALRAPGEERYNLSAPSSSVSSGSHADTPATCGASGLSRLQQAKFPAAAQYGMALEEINWLLPASYLLQDTELEPLADASSEGLASSSQLIPLPPSVLQGSVGFNEQSSQSLPGLGTARECSSPPVRVLERHQDGQWVDQSPELASLDTTIVPHKTWLTASIGLQQQAFI
ncbi:hypothetical protein Q8A67_014435 [Cirrhinus molitorella]|uniref:Uncharacterized protein n=1 Tax=Cirrhinus molitorella TaxID=172907 RepID=A0AA88TJR3_9TELE|nr:hypothetical protein Q8A67_014435 [Cirrhinus molitorella]